MTVALSGLQETGLSLVVRIFQAPSFIFYFLWYGIFAFLTTTVFCGASVLPNAVALFWFSLVIFIKKVNVSKAAPNDVNIDWVKKQCPLARSLMIQRQSMARTTVKETCCLECQSKCRVDDSKLPLLDVLSVDKIHCQCRNWYRVDS